MKRRRAQWAPGRHPTPAGTSPARDVGRCAAWASPARQKALPGVAVDRCIVNVGGRGGRRGPGVAGWQAARSCCASAASGVPPPR
eukprot:2172653-Lingulodinium_polyedra.AAC.1